MKRILTLLFLAAFGSGWAIPSSVRAEEPVSQSEEDQKYIQQYLDAAFNAYVIEDFEKAMMNFQKVLQIDPYDAAALKGVKLCRKKLDESASDREKAEEKKLKLSRKLFKEERWLDAIDNLREIVSHANRQSEAMGLMSEIEVALRKRVSSAAVGSGDYFFYQGILAYLNRRYDDAVRAWKDAERISFENVKVAVFLDRVEQLTKDTAKFETTADRGQAKAAFDVGNYSEAVSLWKRILLANPNDPEAQTELAKAQQMLNKKSRQSQIGEFYDRGLSLFQEGKYAESMKEWENIVAIDSGNAVANDYIEKIVKLGVARSPVQPVPADVSLSTGAPPLEGLDLKNPEAPDSQRLPTSKASASLERGIDSYRAGDYPEAAQFFQNLLITDPEHKEARDWLNRIIKEQNEEADKSYNRGLVAYAQGDIEKAIAEWQTALKVLPNHPAARRALSKIKDEKY